MTILSSARIGQIAIRCHDVPRARVFYRDTLGITHLFDAGPNLCFFDCGGIRLMLSGEPEGAALGAMSSMLYYFVPDIDAVHRELVAKGVRFLDEPHVIAQMPDHALWLAACEDSEGNLLGIMEERRPAAT